MKYAPTEADRLTGDNVRRLRRLHGETMPETLERSGLDLKQSSLSRIELGQRALTLPEATKLAAHWNTTADAIFVKPKLPAPTLNPNFGKVETEQEFLGNPPALFAVPDSRANDDAIIAPISAGKSVSIQLDKPMTPEQYKLEIWLPYLEARYAADTA